MATNNIEVISLTVTPPNASAGDVVTGTVSINRPAPAGGLSVNVIANPAAAATTPAKLLIPQGATRASFKATLNYVGKPSVVIFYANYITTKHASVSVKVALLESVPAALVIPAPVLTGTVTSSPAVPPPPPPIVVVPTVPANLAIVGGSGQNSLTWDASNGATSYKVKRSTVNGGPYVAAAIVTAPSFIDSGLANGTTYYYVVAASNSGGDSANSSQVSATPQSNIPSPPVGVTAIAGDTKATISWSLSNQAVSYNVKRSTINGGPYTLVANVGAITYQDTGLTNGTIYFYVVTVVNSNGESQPSTQVTVTPKISIPGVPAGITATAGDTKVTLTWGSVATATSYNVKRAVITGGPYTTVATPTTNAVVDTGLTDGTKYFYVISAVNSGGQSTNSSEVNATPIAPLPTPTFTDDFSTGSLDTTKWIPSNWNAPGTIAGVNNGIFSPSALDFSQGMLRISMTQVRNADSSVTSTGGELQSKQAFGYGTYEWIMRQATTSPTPNGAGNVVSGQISSGFTYINNSQTEIDFELEGQFPNQMEMTNWSTTAHQQFTQVTLANPTAFHAYKFVWAPGRIDFYIDNVLVSTHTQNVPTASAFQMINHWGTNSTGFGGLATSGVLRYMFVSKVSFWAA